MELIITILVVAVAVVIGIENFRFDILSFKTLAVSSTAPPQIREFWRRNLLLLVVVLVLVFPSFLPAALVPIHESSKLVFLCVAVAIGLIWERRFLKVMGTLGATQYERRYMRQWKWVLTFLLILLLLFAAVFIGSRIAK